MQKVESQFTMIQRRGHRNLNQRFEIVKTLGQGTYGKVKLAVEKKTGRQVRIDLICWNLGWKELYHIIGFFTSIHSHA